jgi:hypothetical protein
MSEYQLTADDVKAIKTADDYVVHLKNGKATLRASKRIQPKKGDPFQTHETSADRVITCSTSVTTIATFVDMYRPGQWRALAALIRPGDSLEFRAENNNSENLTAAGFWNDVLYVSLRRGDKWLVSDWPITSQISSSLAGRAIETPQYALVTRS